MWGNVVLESYTHAMFSTNFPNQKSFILLYLIKWQYFWWFWFSYLFLFYYSIFFNKILQQSIRSNPKIVTSQKAHGKWGDVIICFLPVFWCVNILTNSNSLLKSIEWQTESNSLVVRVRGKQWFWLYKIDPSDISKLMDSNIILGSGKLFNNHQLSECKFDKLLNKSSSMLSVGSPNVFNNEDSIVLLGISSKVGDGKHITPLHLLMLEKLKTPLFVLRTDFTSGGNKNFLTMVSDSFNSSKSLESSSASRSLDTLSTKYKIQDNFIILRGKKILTSYTSYLIGDFFSTDSSSISNNASDLIRDYGGIGFSGSHGITSGDICNNFIVELPNSNSTKSRESRTTFINRVSSSVVDINYFKLPKQSLSVKDSLKFDNRLGESPRSVSNQNLSIFASPENVKRGNPITLKLWSSSDSSEFDMVLCKNPLDSGDLVSFKEGSKSREVFRRRYFTISQKSRKNSYNMSVKKELLVRPESGVAGKLTNSVYSDYFKTSNLPSNNREVFYNTRNNQRLLHVDNLLILPTHTNLTIITNSYDVVHSWFVPGLGLKMDCVPGRSTHHSLYVRTPGFYYGQCAEICGRLHHHMPIKVCFLPLDHFFVWWNHFYFKHCKSARNFIFKLN